MFRRMALAFFASSSRIAARSLNKRSRFALAVWNGSLMRAQVLVAVRHYLVRFSLNGMVAALQKAKPLDCQLRDLRRIANGVRADLHYLPC